MGIVKKLEKAVVNLELCKQVVEDKKEKELKNLICFIKDIHPHIVSILDAFWVMNEGFISSNINEKARWSPAPYFGTNVTNMYYNIRLFDDSFDLKKGSDLSYQFDDNWVQKYKRQKLESILIERDNLKKAIEELIEYMGALK